MVKHYKPASERKSVVIPLRVTAAQHREFKTNAKASGISVSHWIRDAATAACKVSK